jgi:arylsulfatase A-like enzyme
LHDLTTTFLDYAGASELEGMDSMSLRDVLSGKVNTHREYLLSGLEGWRMVFDGRYKLVTGAGESAILYDLEDDPAESQNIAPQHSQVVERLLQTLEMR